MRCRVGDGCRRGGDRVWGEEAPEYVGTEEVCHGVFKGRLAKTVESVMGASSFAWTSPKELDRVVDALKAGYESGNSWARGAPCVN